MLETPPLSRATADARLSVDLDQADLSDDQLADAFRSLGGRALEHAPEAVSLFSEACHRATGLVPRLGQIVCGLVMARGAIAEMDTGEGKTLSAGLASCLLALDGLGVHSVTVNPYLAARDHALMAPVYRLLGLTSSLVHPGMSKEERRAAYRCDIVHGSNSEFVFDRLRDGIALTDDDIVQRGHAHAVVDEADSVLLDEASTPLVLSDGSGTVSSCAIFCDGFAAALVEGDDFEIEVEDGSVHLTPAGTDRAEAALRRAGHLPVSQGLFDGRSDVLGHLDAALKARYRLARDRDYIVRDGKVEIVDANTGRVLEGRRYADGLHEAVEIKEGVPHSGSGDTVSSTTYMNYFGLYGNLCGATGTAMSSASEIKRLYDVQAVRVPPSLPSSRTDLLDRIHATQAERDRAAIEDALSVHATGRPVLVGTASVAESMTLAALLAERGFTERDTASPEPLTYVLLNASRAEHEAVVVSQAGRRHALTIATNMAGRGTDIVLGGDDHAEGVEMSRLGGLHVVGVGRHGSRRIDDQLRGRAGRRGEPGSTVFHLSIEDALVTKHSPVPADSLRRLLEMNGEAALRPLVDQAQRIADALGSDTREALMQYSAVDTVQIEAFHALRREFMSTPTPGEAFEAMRAAAVTRAVRDHMPENSYAEAWDTAALKARIMSVAALDLPVADWAAEDGTDDTEILRRALSALQDPTIEADTLRTLVLKAYDECWREHVARLDVLRRAVAFRTYAMLRPLTEYRVESFPLFARLLDQINDRASAAVSWTSRDR
ncbi:preprotein translocase subunit SecA [Rhizobium sp. BK176]|uniref:preprotein translocase subunit SecA n=1 Tax=Rhizobium sp. BK176 TaxID=2587071 RepID=UPI0021695DD4|nr:preprotein translocase subunit SecA [Rhizobium sp. BK176]MCS4089443.1 preprotein translocase subunit SecA [Rhizobium sp. BK176]